MLHRQQGSYILTVEAGKQLLLSADSEAEASLQAELIDIQERWKTTTVRLEEQKKQLAFLLKVCAYSTVLELVESQPGFHYYLEMSFTCRRDQAEIRHLTHPDHCFAYS